MAGGLPKRGHKYSISFGHGCIRARAGDFINWAIFTVMRLSILEIIIIKSLSYLAVIYNIIIYRILSSTIVKLQIPKAYSYYRS